MTTLLDCFDVTPDVRSSLCRQFDSVSDLLEVYLSKMPRDVDMEEDVENNNAWQQRSKPEPAG